MEAVTQALPILVVGAGPVGLVAAAKLLANGQSVIIFEKRDSVNSVSRASTFHPPTLQILDDLGLLQALLPEGLKAGTIQFREVNGACISLSLSVLRNKAAFPFRFHLEQSLLTQHILDKLQNNPLCEVRLNATVDQVESCKDRVKVCYHNSRTQRTSSEEGCYLIAADGASSRVRESLGIAFEGKAYENPILRIFLNGDVREILPDIAPVTYLFENNDSCSLLENKNGWRVILRLPRNISESTALSLEYQQQELERFLPLTDTIFRNSRSDLYFSECRVAATNHVGRVVLIGDAAHVTNTRGGMNMNCGIHDADRAISGILKSHSENHPGPLNKCMQQRLRIVHDYLVPRTDKPVSSPRAWFRRIRKLADNEQQISRYLGEASMLDMV